MNKVPSFVLNYAKGIIELENETKNKIFEREKKEEEDRIEFAKALKKAILDGKYND